MKETELKPCPFCGGNPMSYSYDPFDGYQGNLTKYAVRCLRCTAKISAATKEKAHEMWNRRADNERTD